MLTFFSVVLCLFTIVFVNFNVLQPQSALALFTLIGMVICFLTIPGIKRKKLGDLGDAPSTPNNDDNSRSWISRVDLFISWILAAFCVVCFGYIFVQTEPMFSFCWPESEFFSRPVSLGERAGDETATDYWIGLVGLLLVLEGARRSIGWVVPCLAILFILHAYYAPMMPNWLLPHVGQTPKQIVSSTFLQSLGVLGPAISVMFRFVFLFVVFGAFLELSGATQFIINFSQRVFRNSVGGPAKVSVLSSGLMGSLSGSAVANAVTTGTFTIPMMKTSGFKSHEAAAVEAAAGTGGAMVPPVMGAAAYMMLELVEGVTFLQIVKAAVIPAVLYYLSLFLIVHFHAKKNAGTSGRGDDRIGSQFDAVDEVAEDRLKPGLQQTQGRLKPELQQTQDRLKPGLQLERGRLKPGLQPERIGSQSVAVYEGLIFFGSLGFLVVLLFANFSAFKAVTGALILILLMTLFRRSWRIGLGPRWGGAVVFGLLAAMHQATFYLKDFDWAKQSLTRPLIATSWIDNEGQFALRLTFESLLNSAVIGSVCLIIVGLCHPFWRPLLTKALRSAAANGVPLIAASACVGIIIGVVQATPMANDFSAIIKGMISTNLLVALIGIMGCSIVLGMGVPSVVCYLLMATLMGSLLVEMQVPILAAHLFMLYFGMMSMVTPPVALAAYAAASIADAPVMRTAFTAFRFSLVGFALPFMFVYQPALLLLPQVGEELRWGQVVFATLTSLLGVLALSAAVVGYLRQALGIGQRIALVFSAILLMVPSNSYSITGWLINGLGLFILIVISSQKGLRVGLGK